MPRLLAACALVLMAGACTRSGAPAGGDSSFAAMQQRGRAVMGVDQYTSVHTFDDLPDGGRIVLQRDTSDTAGVRTIRAHLAGEATRFATGDFSDPMMVHGDVVPGTMVMNARRALIHYTFRALPGGGEVRITTSDAAALRAVHEFVAYQRGAHHAHGESMRGMKMP